MIIAKIIAGLCNQIYFFSTAYALSKEWDEELVIDICVDGLTDWIYMLDFFNLPPLKKISYASRYRMGVNYSRIDEKILEDAQLIDETYFEEIDGYYTIPKEKFNRDYPDKKNIYLKGSFLSRQMFTKYLDDIRNIFTLKEPSDFISAFEQDIKGVVPIGVHIRRAGFLLTEQADNIDFFKAAIVFMRNQQKNVRFYVFSDEINYVKEQLGSAKDIRYVDAMGGGIGDIEEFLCLSKCQYYILSRMSSYGRMAEILNTNENKYSLLFGDNKICDERFVYLTTEQVNILKKEYRIRFDFKIWDLTDIKGLSLVDQKNLICQIGLDSGFVNKKLRGELMLQKAEIAFEQKDLLYARHLCYMTMDIHKGCFEYHLLAGRVLKSLSCGLESMVKYIGASKFKALPPTEVIDLPDYQEYGKLLHAEPKHFVIAPYHHFTSQYISKMMAIGIILSQMGNKVTFLLKRTRMSEKFDDLHAMQEWEENLDHKSLDLCSKEGLWFARFHFGDPCYEYEKIFQNSNLLEFVDQISKEAGSMETILVGRDPRIFEVNIPLRKVFMDFSDPYDDEYYLRNSISNGDLKMMYRNADIVFTKDDTFINKGYICENGRIVFLDSKYQEYEIIYSQDEVSYYNTCSFSNDYLDTALRIALSCIDV